MSQVSTQHRYIVVEGPIGVGKTSLARRLADSFGSELLLEDASSNPFLDRFYRDPRSAALPAQLFFLFQRAQQMQQLIQGDMFNPVRRTIWPVSRVAKSSTLIAATRQFARGRTSPEGSTEIIASNLFYGKT